MYPPFERVLVNQTLARTVRQALGARTADIVLLTVSLPGTIMPDRAPPGLADYFPAGAGIDMNMNK